MGRILGGVFKRLPDLSLAEQGRVITDEIAAWSDDLGTLVSGVIERDRPDAMVTSLFGVVARGPKSAARSRGGLGPLIESFLPSVNRATLVMHASDQVFDFDHESLPENHRYVGSPR